MGNLKNKIGETVGSDKFSASVLTAIIIAVIMVANVFLYVVVELTDFRYHENDALKVTLSGATDDLFASAIKEGKKVKISFCLSEKDIETHGTGSFVYETAKLFAERYPGFIEIDNINIITRRNAAGELVDLEKYKTGMRGEPSAIRRDSVIFECGENYRVVTDSYTSAGFADFYTLDSNKYATSYNGETVMAALISWVMSDVHKSAYFTQYHGEVVDVAFSTLLASAGYYINVIDLRKEEVPEDCDILVISNPTSDFEQAREGSGIRTEMERLKTYMQGGGNLFVALDPYVSHLPVLEGYIAELGITLENTTLESGAKIKNLIKDPSNAITTDGFTLVADYASDPLAEKISEKVERYSDGSVIVREVSALTLSKNAKPLLLSSENSVLEAGGSVVSTGGRYCMAAYAENENEDKSVSRLFVIPSVYLAVSDSLVTNGYSNKDFAFALFEEFFGSVTPPYGCNNLMFEFGTLENLTMREANTYTAIIMLIPVLLAIGGAVVIIRRKNR